MKGLAMRPASFNQDSLSKSSLQDVQLVDEIAPDVFLFYGQWSQSLKPVAKTFGFTAPQKMSSSSPHQFFQANWYSLAFGGIFSPPPAFLKVSREKMMYHHMKLNHELEMDLQ